MTTFTATPEHHRGRLRLRITNTLSGAPIGFLTVSRPGDCDPIGMPSLSYDEMGVEDERCCELLTAAAAAIEASQALWLDLVSMHGPEVGSTTVRLSPGAVADPEQACRVEIVSRRQPGGLVTP